MTLLVALVADDLTGALDASAPFAAAGLPTSVLLRPLAEAAPEPLPAVVGVSSESRDLPPGEAVEQMAAVVRDLLPTAPRLWFKKLDSALRGQPGPELARLAALLGVRRLLATPTLPGEGRVVVGGQLLVDGRPVHQTPLGVRRRGSSAVERLATGGLAARSLPLATVRDPAALAAALDPWGEPGLLVADAESGADLAALAAAVLASGTRLCAGSAGLAAGLATGLAAGGWRLAGDGLAAGGWRLAGGDPSSAASHQPPAASQKPVLVVAGSRHPMAARQLTHAQWHAGVRVVPAGLSAADGERARREVVAVLAAGRHAALTTVGLAEAPDGGFAVSARLGAVVADPAVAALAGGLVLTGGDVAGAVCRALGATRIDLWGEARPNVPTGWLALPGGARLPVVTKAGSFGDEEVLTAAVGWLAGGLCSSTRSCLAPNC